MKEIISLSLGTHSNFVQTHFWNSQDENLKVMGEQGSDPNKEQAIKESTQIIYNETIKSG
jgi:hypothetical protein